MLLLFPFEDSRRDFLLPDRLVYSDIPATHRSLLPIRFIPCSITLFPQSRLCKISRQTRIKKRIIYEIRSIKFFLSLRFGNRVFQTNSEEKEKQIIAKEKLPIPFRDEHPFPLSWPFVRQLRK